MRIIIAIIYLAICSFPTVAAACDGVELQLVPNDGIQIEQAKLVTLDGFDDQINFVNLSGRFRLCLDSRKFKKVVEEWKLEISGTNEFLFNTEIQMIKPVPALLQFKEKPPSIIAIKLYNPELVGAFEKKIITAHDQSKNGSTRAWRNFFFCKKAYERAKKISNYNAEYHAAMCWFYANKSLVINTAGMIKLEPALISTLETRIIPDIKDKTAQKSRLKHAWYQAAKGAKKMNWDMRQIEKEMHLIKLRKLLFYRYGGAFHKNENRSTFCAFLNFFDLELKKIENSSDKISKSVFEEKYKGLINRERLEYYKYASEQLGMKPEQIGCGLN